MSLRFSTPRVSHNPPLSPVLTGTDTVSSCAFLLPLVVFFFSFSLRQWHVYVRLACLIQTLGAFGLLGFRLPRPAPPPPACRTSAANPQRHQLQREPCSFLTQACFSLSWVAMFVTSYVWFPTSHVIVFTWCFSFILDQSKRKRLSFPGIIPYAQTPKGSLLFLKFLLSDCTNCFYQLLSFGLVYIVKLPYFESGIFLFPWD